VSGAPKKSDEKSQPSILLWLMAGAVVVGAIWAFARGGESTPPEPTPVETQAANQPAPEPEPPAVETEPEVAEPEPSEETEQDEPIATPPANKQASSVAQAAANPGVQAPAKPAAPEPAAIAKPEKETPSAAVSAEPPKKPVELAGPFDKAAATAALTSAAAQASSCRQEGDPSGRALVRVTFAESGRAVRAVVEGPPFAGTRTGGCIASVMRRATVPPFGGDRLTVSKTVIIQ
jgi:hypothetical protein